MSIILIFSLFFLFLLKREHEAYKKSISLGLLLSAEISGIVETACARDCAGTAYARAGDLPGGSAPAELMPLYGDFEKQSAFFQHSASIWLLTPSLIGDVAAFYADIAQLRRDTVQRSPSVNLENIHWLDCVRLWQRVESHGFLASERLQHFARLPFFKWVLLRAARYEASFDI